MTVVILNPTTYTIQKSSNDRVGYTYLDLNFLTTHDLNFNLKKESCYLL